VAADAEPDDGAPSVDYADREYGEFVRDPGAHGFASVDYASRHYGPHGDDGGEPADTEGAAGVAEAETWRQQGEGGFGQGAHLPDADGPYRAGYRIGPKRDTDFRVADDPDDRRWWADQMRRLDEDYRTWRESRETSRRDDPAKGR
jgi:hypothetical protein